MNPELNAEMLQLAPGGDLLLAIAGSMDMQKVQNLVEKFAPPKVDSMGNKVEEAIGISPEEMLKELTGDFTIAINGIQGETMIPIELFLGFGVNGEVLQEKLLETVGEMVAIEEQGDFFMINIQGNEIYSGIQNDMWVVTNAKGYKAAVESGSMENSLMDSRFKDFAGGSMGLYLNLDLESYPAMLQGMLSQNPDQMEKVENLTGSFDYLGLSASNYKNNLLLKTNRPSENSLYTLMQLIDPSE